MTDTPPPDAGQPAWPIGCRHPHSCGDNHRQCMYLGCRHQGRDITGEIDAEITRLAAARTIPGDVLGSVELPGIPQSGVSVTPEMLQEGRNHCLEKDGVYYITPSALGRLYLDMRALEPSAPLALPCEATDALNQISAQMPTSEMNEDQIKHADFRYAYDEMIRIARSGLRAPLAPPREVTEAFQVGVEALRDLILRDGDEARGTNLCVEAGYWENAKSYLKSLLPNPAALNAPARGESDVKVAARLIDEMLAAQSRFASDWIDSRELTPAQIQDGKLRDEARSKILSMFEGITATIDARARVDKNVSSETAAWNNLVQATWQWGNYHMDQWDKFYFNTEFGPVYVTLSRQDAYPDSFALLDAPTDSDLSEMRGICGGEVDEITRTPEEQAEFDQLMTEAEEEAGWLPIEAAREARAMGDVAPDENSLPMELLPKDTDSWVLERSDNFHPNGSYEVRIYVGDSRLQIEGIGATPRAAMIAAIEAARERGS